MGSAARKADLARRQDQRLAKRDTQHPGFSHSAGLLELRPKIASAESIEDAWEFIRQLAIGKNGLEYPTD